jgi:hypothetical protein
VEHIGITPDRKRSYPFRASGRPTTNGFGALPAGWPAATTRSPCTAPPCPCKISARRGAASRRPSRTCRLPRRAAGWREPGPPLLAPPSLSGHLPPARSRERAAAAFGRVASRGSSSARASPRQAPRGVPPAAGTCPAFGRACRVALGRRRRIG